LVFTRNEKKLRRSPVEYADWLSRKLYETRERSLRSRSGFGVNDRFSSPLVASISRGIAVRSGEVNENSEGAKPGSRLFSVIFAIEPSTRIGRPAPKGSNGEILLNTKRGVELTYWYRSVPGSRPVSRSISLS
jgi:hypothetical protein